MYTGTFFYHEVSSSSFCDLCGLYTYFYNSLRCVCCCFFFLCSMDTSFYDDFLLGDSSCINSIMEPAQKEASGLQKLCLSPCLSIFYVLLCGAYACLCKRNPSNWLCALLCDSSVNFITIGSVPVQSVLCSNCVLKLSLIFNLLRKQTLIV